MRTFLRTWFAALAAGCLLLFVWHVAIMGIEGLHLISLTVLGAGGIYGWLAWQGRVFLDEWGLIQDWLAFNVTLIFGVPLTLVVFAACGFLVLQYPRQGHYELTFKPPELTHQQKLARRELTRWISRTPQDHDFYWTGNLPSGPTPGISHPAPEVGALTPLLRKFSIAPRATPSPMDPADLAVLTEFWQFLHANPLGYHISEEVLLSPPSYFPRERFAQSRFRQVWEKAVEIEGDVMTVLRTDQRMGKEYERFILWLRAYRNGSAVNDSLEAWVWDQRQLRGQLVFGYLVHSAPEDPAKSLQRSRLLAKVAVWHRESLLQALAAENVRRATTLRNMPRKTLRESFMPGLVSYTMFFGNLKKPDAWIVPLGVFQSTASWPLLTLDRENTIQLQEDVLKAVADLSQEPWDTRHDDFLRFVSWSPFNEYTGSEYYTQENPYLVIFLETGSVRNFTGRELLTERVEDLEVALTIFYEIQCLLLMNSLALEVAATGELPEDVPLDPTCGRPLQVWKRAGRLGQFGLVTLPPESRAVIQYPITSHGNDFTGISFNLPEAMVEEVEATHPDIRMMSR